MGISPSVPSGRSPSAEKARKRFEAALQRSIAKTRNIALNILIWGQNPASGTPLALKRIEIRAKLIEEGHNAMFSEELSASLNPHLSEKAKEFHQAKIADLIVIMIEDAPGASAEAHDFCNHPDIAPKCKVMVPRKYKDGYSARGAIANLEAAHGGVFWYEPDDIIKCHLLSHVLIQAEALRQIRVMHGA